MGTILALLTINYLILIGLLFLGLFEIQEINRRISLLETKDNEPKQNYIPVNKQV